MTTILSTLFGSERISWRRLFAFMLIVVLATVLLWMKFLAGDQWVLVVQWIGGAFIGVDGAEKIATAASRRTQE